MRDRLPASEDLLLDDAIRGVPPGTAGLANRDVAARRWRPTDGRMALPVLTLDEAAFDNNLAAMMRYVREQGLAIAPHAKTPMAPDLARKLIDAGAWGATVADIRQAGVMLRGGIDRLILANEVGGRGGARRLAALLADWPRAEVHAFVDSRAALDALAAAWREAPEVPPLRVLVELGAGRAGARTLREAEALIAATAASGGRLTLSGVAAYEGAAAQPTPEATEKAIADLLAVAGEALRKLRASVGAGKPLMLTAGGSVHFDRVAAALGPLARQDGATTLILRSGAIFFHDHGVYERGLAALDARGGFRLGGGNAAGGRDLSSGLASLGRGSVAAGAGLAICGLGMRDVSFDQGLPRPLAAYREERRLALEGAETVKLNDQHAFLTLPASNPLAVGDVVEFGVSHPCTCLDRYRFLFALDDSGHVRRALPTYFG